SEGDPTVAADLGADQVVGRLPLDLAVAQQGDRVEVELFGHPDVAEASQVGARDARVVSQPVTTVAKLGALQVGLIVEVVDRTLDQAVHRVDAVIGENRDELKVDPVGDVDRVNGRIEAKVV